MEIAVPDTVLAVFAAGIGFLAVAVAKARIDAQPDAMARRHRAELFQHIDGTGVHRDPQLADARQRGVINHIGSENNIVRMRLRIVTRRQRTLDLAQRHRIHLHALLAHQAQNMNI